jgi:hypothetical protein
MNANPCPSRQITENRCAKISQKESQKEYRQRLGEKQLLERLIFSDSSAAEWVQDIWALSPTLGETAARLVDVLNSLVEGTSEEKLENLLQGFYQQQFED